MEYEGRSSCRVIMDWPRRPSTDRQNKSSKQWTARELSLREFLSLLRVIKYSTRDQTTPVVNHERNNVSSNRDKNCR